MVGGLDHVTAGVAVGVDEPVAVDEQVGAVVVPVGVATDTHRVLVGQHVADPHGERQRAQHHEVDAPPMAATTRPLRPRRAGALHGGRVARGLRSSARSFLTAAASWMATGQTAAYGYTIA